MLHIGMMPALNRSKKASAAVWMKFLKNTPPINNPRRATPRKISAPTLSNSDATLLLNVFSPIRWPSARVIRMKAQAMITPPGNPPPGVRCPYSTT